MGIAPLHLVRKESRFRRCEYTIKRSRVGDVGAVSRSVSGVYHDQKFVLFLFSHVLFGHHRVQVSPKTILLVTNDQNHCAIQQSSRSNCRENNKLLVYRSINLIHDLPQVII